MSNGAKKKELITFGDLIWLEINILVKQHHSAKPQTLEECQSFRTILQNIVDETYKADKQKYKK